MRKLHLAVLGLLALAAASAALAATPLAPSTPAAHAPIAAPRVATNPKPLPMAQFPGCQSGYFPADQECVFCGDRNYPAYESCTTCANLWTGDQYTTCSQCDFVGTCTPP
jgi:hypothetical protein